MERSVARELQWPPREFDRTPAACISCPSRNSNDTRRDARLSVRLSARPYKIYIAVDSFIYGFFFLYFVSFFLSRHPRRSPYTLGAEDAAVSVRRRRRRRREHSHVLCKRDEIYPGLISITKIPLVVAIRLRHLARSGRIPNLPSRVLLLKHDGPRPSERVR